MKNSFENKVQSTIKLIYTKRVVLALKRIKLVYFSGYKPYLKTRIWELALLIGPVSNHLEIPFKKNIKNYNYVNKHNIYWSPSTVVILGSFVCLKLWHWCLWMILASDPVNQPWKLNINVHSDHSQGRTNILVTAQHQRSIFNAFTQMSQMPEYPSMQLNTELW